MFKTTPDLSQEFHPVPRPMAKVKMPKTVKKDGKKTKTWTNERDQLKKDFFEMGIKTCELKFTGCWKNNALGFAHIDKRRKLTPEDLPSVVLACNSCHQVIEAWPAPRMKKHLLEIIMKRKVKV